MNYPIIKYGFNWNNKLDCNCYTTIRISNDAKYVIGQKYSAYLKGHHIHDVEIVSKKKIYIKDINEYIAGLDTGYNADECKKLIRTMYSKKIKDIENQKFDFILFKKLKD